VQEGFKKAGFEAGMNEILYKPVYRDELMTVLKKYEVINN